MTHVNMCVRMYVYIIFHIFYICVNISKDNVYIYVHIYIYSYVYVKMYTYINTCTHTYICIYTCMYVYEYVHIYVRGGLHVPPHRKE